MGFNKNVHINLKCCVSINRTFDFFGLIINDKESSSIVERQQKKSVSEIREHSFSSFNSLLKPTGNYVFNCTTRL